MPELKLDLSPYEKSFGEWKAADLSESVNSILQKVPLMALSIGAIGVPNVCPVYFALHDEAQLCFVTNVNSRHGKLIDKTDAASVAIYDSLQPWINPKAGIQMIGKCRRASIVETVHARSRYGNRFPESIEETTVAEMADAAMQGFRYFLYAPTEIKIFDEVRFGEETYIVLVSG